MLTSTHEGLDVVIHTADWTIGTSVFVLTLHPAETGRSICRAVRKENPTWVLLHKPAFHEGKFGVRIWRTG